jgi:peptidoglycan/LPS O-acetylase OafA/YrhL
MRFTVLDGWRGIAALSVALYHLRAAGHFYDAPLVRHAFIFVDFFFVLSGFVLLHAYRSRLHDATQLKPFILSRFGRIYPLHIAIVLLFVAFECARLAASARGGVFTMARRPFTEEASPWAIVTNVFLVQGLGVNRGLTLNLPSWSISAEFWTYLIFAAVCLGTGMRTKAVAVAAALLACGGAAVVAVFSHYYIDTSYDFGLFRCLYGFFIGVLTYMAFKAMQSMQIGRTAATVCEALTLAAIVAFVSYAGDNLLSLASPVFFAGVVAVFAFERGVVSDILKTKPVAILGLLSYSIYMVHSVVLLFLHQGFMVLQKLTGTVMVVKMPVEHGVQTDFVNVGGPWVMDALAIAYLLIVVGCSLVTYRMIEDPGRRYFARLAGTSRKGDTRKGDSGRADRSIAHETIGTGAITANEPAMALARQTLPAETAS